MSTITIRLRPGDSAKVVAQDPSLKPDQGLPGAGSAGGEHPDNTLPPTGDLGLGPVDPDYGIDVDAPYPDQGLPGSQPRPDQGLPPFPSHPIVLPPLPTQPLPPIPPGDLVPGWEKKVAWTPVTGWVVVAIPTGPVPTPSKRG